ncbi:hypothetical protein N2152v2_003232 [Parachlorella kessleri]
MSTAKLGNILDEQQVEVPEQGEHQQALYEEHAARVRAEGEAQTAARKLAVAQEQFGELLSQRAADAAVLAQRAEQLEGLLGQVLGDGADAQVADALKKEVAALRAGLACSVEEAQATAALAQAEVERQKRTSVQVAAAGAAQADLRQGSDSDLKRARDEGGNASPRGTCPAPVNSEGGVSTAAAGADSDAHMETSDGVPGDMDESGEVAGKLQLHDTFRERARYIPLRLSSNERRLLRLLEAALSVSEYTDKVDILSWKSKTGRVHAQIKDICAILCGLTVAQSYKRGQQLIQDRDFSDPQLVQFFQDCFEVGRRYKISNPEKMRDSYGRLMYMLMDSSEPEIEELLGFSCVRPLRTVYRLLEERGGLALLDDPLLQLAVAEIVSEGRPRHEIDRAIKAKERARAQLAKRYRSHHLSEDDILLCMYSISDNNSYLLFNRDPIDRMIDFLLANFRSGQSEEGLSLAIQGGRGGARLTHSHDRQYHYVLQSLTLWREISHEMYKLWYLADADMTQRGNYYRLQNTGQGLQRVQPAPGVGRAMQQILARCQRRIGTWVGSSVVHLGDHNVPNALMFIDKYTQVPRILNPLVLVLEEIPRLCRDPAIAKYVEESFGSVEDCRLDILVDFFRHGFDGSGADNFFDAGSCIDGRLTSAWNWCSKVEKKSYYHVFKLAGFSGFDGDFKG